jgi:hypothetical protein
MSKRRNSRGISEILSRIHTVDVTSLTVGRKTLFVDI